PIYSLGEFERCIITDWRLQPTERAFDRRNEELVKLAERHPGACAYLEMIEPSSKPPPAPLRKHGMEVFRKLGLNLTCVAVVVHGTEMRAALVRAVLTGMTFLIPQFQPARVFKESEAAAKWLRPRLGMDAEFDRRFVGAAEFLRPPQPAARTA
ncbi:MAG TPA: hypothetical protein VIV11_22640, partial [Kofleriaceae bacterium]